jgi:hypothetical protein
MSIFKRFIKKDRHEQPEKPQSESKPNEPSQLDEEYRSANIEFLPVGTQQIMAYAPSVGSAHLISASDAELINRCDAFATLDEHAENIGHSLMLDPSDHDRIKRRLREFADKGLLIAYGSIQTPGHSPSQAGPTSNIASVVVVTCDRVETAKRGLESYAGSAKKFGRSNGYVLLDDSSDPDTRASYRRMCQALKRDLGVSVSYAGFDEKKSFAEALTAEGLPGQVIEFCLFGAPGHGPIYGANNNATFLNSIGESILSVDDDTICKIARAPDYEEGLDLCSKHDPTFFHFYRSRADAWNEAEYVDQDPFELHEKLLGGTLPDCVARHTGSGGLGLDDAGARLVEALNQGAGKVAVTSFGMAGDSGMGSTRYFLHQQGENRERLVESETDYQTWATTRNVLRAVKTTTVSEGTFFMFCAAALDMRELLPPVFPIGRNNDGMFSAALRVVSPRTYIGHLPWMITHDPPMERTSSKEANIYHGAHFHLMDFIISCVGSFQPPGGEARVADRIRALGRHLTWLGTLDVRDFEDFIRQIFLRQMGGNVARLEESLGIYNRSPEYWANDVEEYLDAVLEAMPKREIVHPAELEQEYGLEEALSLVQRLIERYGELAILWPDIVGAAKKLRESGLGLAKAI